MSKASTSMVLKQLRIAAPCSVEWSAMQGDDRVRYCGQCKKNVYNLIGMDDYEAAELLTQHEGEACIQAYQRSDGTLMTQNCPVGLRKLRQRMAWGLGGLAAGFAMLLSSVTFGLSGRFGARVKRFEPFARVARLAKPAPAAPFFGGRMVRGAIDPTVIAPLNMTPAQAKARSKRIQRIFRNDTPVDPIYKDKDGNFKLRFPNTTEDRKVLEYPISFDDEDRP